MKKIACISVALVLGISAFDASAADDANQQTLDSTVAPPITNVKDLEKYLDQNEVTKMLRKDPGKFFAQLYGSQLDQWREIKNEYPEFTIYMLQQMVDSMNGLKHKELQAVVKNYEAVIEQAKEEAARQDKVMTKEERDRSRRKSELMIMEAQDREEDIKKQQQTAKDAKDGKEAKEVKSVVGKQ